MMNCFSMSLWSSSVISAGTVTLLCFTNIGVISGIDTLFCKYWSYFWHWFPYVSECYLPSAWNRRCSITSAEKMKIVSSIEVSCPRCDTISWIRIKLMELNPYRAALNNRWPGITGYFSVSPAICLYIYRWHIF